MQLNEVTQKARSLLELPNVVKTSVLKWRIDNSNFLYDNLNDPTLQ